MNFTKIWRHCIESEAHKTLETAINEWNKMEKADCICNENNSNHLLMSLNLYKQEALSYFSQIFQMAQSKHDFEVIIKHVQKLSTHINQRFIAI